jgi:carbonic anhydrase
VSSEHSRPVTVQSALLSDYFLFSSGSLDPWFMGETQERQDNQASQEMFVQAARTTRLGRPADPAGISAFLLSDKAEWSTGRCGTSAAARTCASETGVRHPRLMTEPKDLIERNAVFAADGFVGDLTINPSGNMMVIGCVDPRVDPGHILGLANGEAAIIRNVGGRITPATLRTMGMLGKVGAANASTHRPGDWNLVILHHTDCGMTDLAPFPDLLAEYFEIPVAELEAKSVSDPVGSVQVDVEVIKRNIHASAYLVTGLVYDVDTGLVETVVPPTLLSPG